jgi:hypothetical protein
LSFETQCLDRGSSFAYMQLGNVVLGAEIESRSQFGQRSEPILAEYMGDVFHALVTLSEGIRLALILLHSIEASK